MSALREERLYSLLPAVYRLRDADPERGHALRALLSVIERELQTLEGDIGRLYDNWFIETCDEWIVPYLGDLLGVRGLLPIEQGTFTQRGLVANTLGYRRRKGTAAILEQLARDVTDWSTKAVEFFQVLGRTAHLNHVRPDVPATVGLRDVERLGLISTPFDRAAHTVDVRHIDNRRGMYNIPHVGLFLWRLQNYALEQSVPRAVADPPDGRYTFASAGYDAPLFTLPETEQEITQLAGEINVRAPIRPAAFFFDLRRYQQPRVADRPSESSYYGPDRSLRIIKDGAMVLAMNVMCMDLESWNRRPALVTGKVAVDVRRGRLAFAVGDEPMQSVRVSYNYGFSGDVGGGPYDRRRRKNGSSQPDESDTVADPAALGTLIHVPQDAGTIAAALEHWKHLDYPSAVIEIGDSGTYEENVNIVMSGSRLVIQAANTQRPTLIGDIKVTEGSADARLEVNGLLIAGSVYVKGTLNTLSIVHSTLIPGRRLHIDRIPQEPDSPSLAVDAPNDRLMVAIERSITGPLCVPEGIAGLTVSDSIIDAPLRGRPAHATPALVSGIISAVALTSSAPSIDVTIGDDGPHTARLTPGPTTIAEVRDRLEQAIRAAHDSPAFGQARVIVVTDGAGARLVILPGLAQSVAVAPAGADPTVGELALDQTSVRRFSAMIGGPLGAFAGLSALVPALDVTMGDEGPRTVQFSSVPTTIDAAAARLQEAIRSAAGGATAAFTEALIGMLDDRLVAIPGVEGGSVILAPAPLDPVTVRELALDSDRPAIVGSDAGDQPGPPLVARRATIFGAAHVRELTLASETIFTDPVWADRRQVGCARFSAIPVGSRTPMRYRCQDVAPFFTSVRYGDPGYAQLGLACADEIRAGAEDENEMGAFHFLQQAQRIKNLRTSLDEYLRLGLEAGTLFVT